MKNSGKLCTPSYIWRGYYDRFCPDVFETLSPPPQGDLDNLAETRRRLPSSICTKGNLDLGLLREGTPDQVADATLDILAATRGYRHMVGTADSVLPSTPIENIKAMVAAAKAWGG